MKAAIKAVAKAGKAGFTLIEIIVVIAVIAVLAAIAVSAFGGVIRSTNETADTSAAKAITHAVNSATADLQNGKAGEQFTTATTLADIFKSARLSEDILTTKQQKLCFCFDLAKSEVVLLEKAGGTPSGYVLLLPQTALSELFP